MSALAPLWRALAPLRLALAHARHHRVRTALLVLCVAMAAFLPLGTRVLVAEFQDRLLARARSTPLLAGAPGSRFDLVMAGLYFRRTGIPPLTMKDWRGLASTGLARVIPLHARATVRGLPLVCTSPDYLEARGLTLARGEMFLATSEAVLGAGAARRLGLSAGAGLTVGAGVGGEVYTDPRDLHDIAVPASQRLLIVGILAPAGTPDDDAIFADLSTALLLEGLAHAHADAERDIPEQLVLERDPGNSGRGARVVVSEELVEDNRVTHGNAPKFHGHGDPDALPISACIVLPDSDKAGSILKARTNAGKATPSGAQMVVPQEAVLEMLGYVARLRQFVDGLSVVIGLSTLVTIGLVTALSIRVRAREVETLAKIGFGRGFIAGIFAWEVLAVLGVGGLLAGAGAAALRAFPIDLVKFV